nr:FixH family protein [uncultured Bacillus sp.]
MKRKWYLFVLLLLLFFLITACSEQKAADRVPQFLDVQLSLNPEQGQVNEPITFTAKATYGDKAVTNADEVEFEIWRANDENHEKIMVEHSGDGIYKLEKSFAEEGTYYVYSHVTAEGYHAMPKKEFVIGQPSEPETNGGTSQMTNTQTGEEHQSQ